MDEDNEIEYEEGTIQDDIAKAFDAVAEQEPEPEVVEPEPVVEAPQEIEEPVDEVVEEVAPEVTPDTEVPPVSLPPAAREVWKDTPAAMKEAIARREADYAKGVEKYRENAQRAQMMDTALQPFQQYIGMTGQSPPQVVNNLLQTASMLQMGSPVQRAQTISQLINQFGVDIQMLDSILADGAPPPQNQEDLIRQAARDEARREFEAQKQYEYQVAQQKIMGSLTNEIAQFGAGKEFYTDVRMDMADILDMAASRKIDMPLEEAYRRACLIHPEISRILETRNKQPTQSQRRAASSIRGNQGGVISESEPDDLKSAIEKAWDQAAKG
jgi:hypothetical protein